MISYREEDFVEVVKGLGGADVVLDNMGASYLDRNLSALAPDGHLAVIGMQGGRTAELDLGKMLVKRLRISVLGLRGRPVDGPNGKAAIVGLDGEIEHGSALIHTLKFGNHFRDAAQASTLLPAVEKRAASGTVFDIPLKHFTDASIRSHHQTIEVRVSDAPHPNEIVIALAGAAQGRPQQRLASLRTER